MYPLCKIVLFLLQPFYVGKEFAFTVGLKPKRSHYFVPHFAFMVQFAFMTSSQVTQSSPVPTQAHNAATLLPPQVDALLVYVARRRLLLPVLLFVTAHRPLGFVAGQLLFAVQPLTLLFPSLDLRVWAETLSSVDGLRCVEEKLSAVGKQKLGNSEMKP